MGASLPLMPGVSRSAPGRGPRGAAHVALTDYQTKEARLSGLEKLIRELHLQLASPSFITSLSLLAPEIDSYQIVNVHTCPSAVCTNSMTFITRRFNSSFTSALQ